MRTLTAIALLLIAPMALAGPSPAPGELDVSAVVRTLPAMPPRGATMEAVRASLGPPRTVLEPVGDPPITRWVYDDFIVYFEYDRVLDSVVPRKH